MLPDAATSTILTGVFTLSAVVITTLTQTFNTRRNQRFELNRESLRLKSETYREHADLIRGKLERAHVLLSEISREFSLTFLTIDWSAEMLPSDFHNKYRDLCAKAAEVQMIVDFYAPSVRESVEELYKLMGCYWMHFHLVLVMVEKGEKVDCTTSSYSEAENYSIIIPSNVYKIQREIREIAYSFIDS
jgi:hypothetical protein